MKLLKIGLSCLSLCCFMPSLHGENLLESTAQNEASLKDNIISGSQIPAIINDHIIIGTAYNSTTGEFIHHQPVSGQVNEQYEGVDFKFNYDSNSSYDEILDALNGGIDASANVYSIQVNAGDHIAKSSAETDYASSYTFIASATPKKQTLIPSDTNEGYQLSSVGERIANEYSDQLLNIAGDEFVSSIEYGAQLFVNLNIEYLNSQDKKDIGGYLDFDVLEGVFSLQGELDFLDEKTKESVKITVRALQRGGNPTSLLTIIPNNIATCSLKNPEPCFNLFEQGIQYAKNDFALQFNELSDYNIVSYQTTRYESASSALTKLVPNYQNISSRRNHLLYELNELYKKAIVDEQRAQELFASYYSWLPDEQQDAVTQLRHDAYTNAWIYYTAADYCQKHPYGDDCVNNWESMQAVCIEQNQGCITDYDVSLLEIPTRERKVHQCEQARQLATQRGLISDETSLRYRKLAWAPVFMSLEHDNATILEWTHCQLALSSYGNYFE